MRAGTLRHRVTVQTQFRASDSQGGSTFIWSAIADNVFASIQPDEDGTEPTQGQKVASQIGHKVRIRYRSGITPAQRLVFSGRVLWIKSVQSVDERRRELVLRCIEKLDGVEVETPVRFSGGATVTVGSLAVAAAGDSGVFLAYDPGDTGYTFTRASTASYVQEA